MLEVLSFLQVKFSIIEKINSVTPVLIQNINALNAFNVLMNNSRQPLLSQHCTEYNRCNQLYNEIIDLFRDQKLAGQVACTIQSEKHLWIVL